MAASDPIAELELDELLGPEREEERSGRTVLWLVAASAAVAASLAAMLADGIAAHIVGYACASGVAFSLVAVFRRRSTAEASATGVVLPGYLSAISVALLGGGFVVALVHAWFIARHYAG